jgi:alkanesulfonate monooxygenase SsuD/methylene tetrahydromethanopterin reductase-like flavin-dependent oxidoreductase (luciferase family)
MRPFGIDFKSPLRELREYVTVLRTLLHEGQVEFQGKFVRARARIGRPLQTPVMISALQQRSFRLAGEITDGAITWSARPPTCANTHGRRSKKGTRCRATGAADGGARARVSKRTRRRSGSGAGPDRMYARFQFYRDMFAKSGYPGAAEDFSQALTDELVVYGSSDQVAQKLRALAASE